MLLTWTTPLLPFLQRTSFLRHAFGNVTKRVALDFGSKQGARFPRHQWRFHSEMMLNGVRGALDSGSKRGVRYPRYHWCFHPEVM